MNVHGEKTSPAVVRGTPVDPVVLERSERTHVRDRAVGDIMHVGVLNGRRSAHWRIEEITDVAEDGSGVLHLRRVVPESVPVPGMPGFVHTVWTEVLA